MPLIEAPAGEAHGFRLVSVACDFCGSAKRHRVLEKRGALIDHSFTLVGCDECGLVYVTPRVALSDMQRLYDADYYAGRGFDRTVSYDSETVAGKLNAENQAALDTLIDVMTLRDSKVLDVGCGNGKLLSALTKLGAIAYGIESSLAGQQICAAQGLSVLAGDLFDSSLDGHQFDAITAIEVLEHVPSPTDFLTRIRSLLRPGGTFFFTTGNWSLVRTQTGTPYIMPEGHIYYFTPLLMRRFLHKTGFVEDMRTFSRHWFVWRALPRQFRSTRLVRWLALAARLLAPEFAAFPVGRNAEPG